MSERFLADLVREADPPRDRSWFYDYWWTFPAGLAFAVGLTAAFYGHGFTAAAFIFGGIGICWIGREMLS